MDKIKYTISNIYINDKKYFDNNVYWNKENDGTIVAHTSCLQYPPQCLLDIADDYYYNDNGYDAQMDYFPLATHRITFKTTNKDYAKVLHIFNAKEQSNEKINKKALEAKNNFNETLAKLKKLAESHGFKFETTGSTIEIRQIIEQRGMRYTYRLWAKSAKNLKQINALISKIENDLVLCID